MLPTPQDCCVRFAVVVAFHSATLTTRRALHLTWAGLSPAGSRQLPGALVPHFEIGAASQISAISLIEFGSGTGPPWNRRVRAGSMPECPFANRSPSAAPSCFRCFLQLNISQTNNLQIVNTRILHHPTHSAAPSCFRCFLQRNISQTNNRQIGNTRILPLPDPYAPNRRKRRAAPSKTKVVTCSTCFIRSRSGSVLRFPRFAATGKIEASWAERGDTANSAIIGYAHDDNSRLIGAVDPSRLLLYCQHIAV